MTKTIIFSQKAKPTISITPKANPTIKITPKPIKRPYQRKRQHFVDVKKLQNYV